MVRKPHKVAALGFGSCEKQAAHVARELSVHYDEEVTGISFRQAHSDPDEFYKLTRGAEVMTHSAGMVNLKGTKPERIIGVAAPLRASRRQLIGRAAKSGYDLLRPSENDTPEIVQLKRTCGENLTVEVSMHVIANLGKLGVIAGFDAVDEAIAAQEAGIETELVYMNQDRLFQLTEAHKQKADAAALPITMIDGGHEDFVCWPADTVRRYEEARELIVA